MLPVKLGEKNSSFGACSTSKPVAPGHNKKAVCLAKVRLAGQYNCPGGFFVKRAKLSPHAVSRQRGRGIQPLGQLVHVDQIL